MAKKSEEKNVILPSERYEVPTEKELTKIMSEMKVDLRQKTLEEAGALLPDVRKIIDSTRALTDSDVDDLTEAYIYAGQIASLGSVIKSEIKNRVQSDLDKKNVLSIDSPRFETEFTNSEPKRTVTFDIEGLKEDHPDIVKMVSGRSGKPLSKADRAELDEQAEQLKTRLQDLNKKLANIQARIAADDRAHQVEINEDLLDRIIDNDDSLQRFRHVTKTSSRFYFKNHKIDGKTSR